MSGFSNKIKQIIQESGYTVYQISKESGLGRTSIHRMMTGDFLPSRDFLNKFSAYMRILPKDYAELRKLYIIEKDGIEKYYNRSFIKSVFREFSILIERRKLNLNARVNMEWNMNCKNSNGYMETLKLIGAVLEHELNNYDEVLVCFHIPVICEDIYQMIINRFQVFEGNMTIKHMCCLNQNPARTNNQNYNLQIVKNAFVLKYLFGDCYQAKYCYTRLEEDDGYFFLWPYYFITHDYIVLISHDGNRAFFSEQRLVVEEYQKQFDTIYREMKVLLDTPEEIPSAKKKQKNYYNGEKQKIDLNDLNTVEIIDCISSIELKFYGDNERHFFVQESTITNALRDYLFLDEGDRDLF